MTVALIPSLSLTLLVARCALLLVGPGGAADPWGRHARRIRVKHVLQRLHGSQHFHA